MNTENRSQRSEIRDQAVLCPLPSVLGTIVLWQIGPNSYPVRFFPRGFSICSRAEASTFPSDAAALARIGIAIKQCGQGGGKFALGPRL